MGRLSTHVLDTVGGGPAGNVAVELHHMAADGGWLLVKRTLTNKDGRTDEPLLSDAAFKAGTYMLSFHIGAYFAKTGAKTASPPFLDVVPVRFGVAEPGAHYHVPLLASPWSYSTYRGS